MLSGCLIEDPPPYTQPTQTAPRIDTRLGTPPMDEIYVLTPDDPISFTVQFSSEDAGDPILGFLFLDYVGKPIPHVGADNAPASTLDKGNRPLQITYDGVELAAGCHRMTMRISHEPNFSRERTGEPIDLSDVAEAYWWLNVVNFEAGVDASTLRNCPRATDVPP